MPFRIKVTFRRAASARRTAANWLVTHTNPVVDNHSQADYYFVEGSEDVDFLSLKDGECGFVAHV